MTSPAAARYGTWASPVTARSVATASVRLGGIVLDGDDIYWIEGRPDEGGRSVVVRRRADGPIADVTPAGSNVRTRAHEYGGGAFAVRNGTLYYSEFSDHRLYKIGAGTGPEPLTPAGRCFYADLTADP